MTWPAQAMRVLVLQVEAAAIEGERLFAAGVLTVEPVRVGDFFSGVRPGRGALGPEQACSLRVERILWHGVYVTWLDCHKPVELELSGDVRINLPRDAELCGESNPPLEAFETLGRGERHTSRR